MKKQKGPFCIHTSIWYKHVHIWTHWSLNCHQETSIKIVTFIGFLFCSRYLYSSCRFDARAHRCRHTKREWRGCISFDRGPSTYQLHYLPNIQSYFLCEFLKIDIKLTGTNSNIKFTGTNSNIKFTRTNSNIKFNGTNSNKYILLKITLG